MSLLTKAKVITTPTAYSDGILHSVKPVENLGSELISSFTNGTTYPLDTFVSSGNNITSLIKSSGFAGCVSNGNTFVLGDKIKVSFSYTKNSGDDLRVVFSSVVSGAGAQISNAETISSSGEYSFTFTITSSATGYLQFGTGNASHSINASITNISAKKIIGADFTFTRNSSATRVGEDGYIQDVQIIGGELVQNNDFEQIGSEEVTNGSFDDGGTNWSSGGLVTFADGKASFVDNGTNTYSFITQTVFTASKTYKIEINISRLDGGQVEVLESGGTIGLFSDEGIKTIYHTASSGDIAIKRYSASPNFDFDIDNVSVKEVGQNWTFGTGWSMGDGKAVVNGTNTFLEQASTIEQSTPYRISFTLSDYVSGNCRIALGGYVIGDVYNANGTYSADVVSDASSNTSIYFYAQNASDFSIDDISIKKITDDTNLPRINYEGFSYENGLPIYGSGKGHFLLEGQRSNIAYEGGGLSLNNASQTLNFGISPSGDNDSTRLETTVSSTSFVRTGPLTTLGTQACSIFVKKGVGDYIQLLHSGNGNHYANYDLVNGVVTLEGNATTASIESYGDWLRLIAVFDSVTVSADFRLYLSDLPSSGYGGASSAVGNYIEYWGVQVEIGDYATSYIANTTPLTIVTRAAETCNNAGNADLFDSEGVLYAEIAALANDGTYRRIGLSDNTSNNALFIGYVSTSNQIQLYITSGGVGQASMTYTLDNALKFNKIAVRYKNNDFSFWINGVQVETDTSGTLPIGLKELAFDRGSGSSEFYGKTKMVGVFPYLSNDEMECLTGEGYGSFQAMALANNYTIIQG